jgi:hypothetical protein
MRRRTNNWVFGPMKTEPATSALSEVQLPIRSRFVATYKQDDKPVSDLVIPSHDAHVVYLVGQFLAKHQPSQHRLRTLSEWL